MKNQNEIISFAPWLFGSSIFYKEASNLQTMLNTFDNHPIDTFCASPIDYEMLDRQQQNNTHLKQLFSTKPVDPLIKARWYSLTNLHIHDGSFTKPFFLYIISFFSYSG
jgi:acyl-coenzyme A synthetase/AMP-(fatty) acid ligase